jgi:hypothetical protein
MNFASHYFFQGGTSDLFNAGLILADLIPLSYKKPFPLLPAIKRLLNNSSLLSADKELFEGIQAHFAADIIFHRSDFFHTSVNESIKIAGGSGGIPAPLHHILVELFMDRFLVKNNATIVSDMYDSFSRCFTESLSIFSSHVHVETDTAQICERFSLNRTVMKYGEFSVIAEILTAIGSRVRLPFNADDSTIIRIEQAYTALENPIREYFEISQKIFSDISPSRS